MGERTSAKSIELAPIVEKCKLCGDEITLGHTKMITTTLKSGTPFTYNEVADHKVSFSRRCPKDPEGRHTVTGM